MEKPKQARLFCSVSYINPFKAASLKIHIYPFWMLVGFTNTKNRSERLQPILAKNRKSYSRIFSLPWLPGAQPTHEYESCSILISHLLVPSIFVRSEMDIAFNALPFYFPTGRVSYIFHSKIHLYFGIFAPAI